jgi:uroporphyrinogen-III synthase
MSKAAANKVILTRPSGPYPGSERLAAKLQERGFKTLELPLLRCVARVLSREELLELRGFFFNAGSERKRWLVLLSPNAVWVLREILRSSKEGDNSEMLLDSSISIAAQGSGTAQAIVECFGREPDFVPSVFVAEEFVREFSTILRGSERILVPQSADGRDIFAPTLRGLGYDAMGVSIYSIERGILSAEEVSRYREFVDPGSVIVFMSPSAARAAREELGEQLGTTRILSVGPITSQALRRLGYPVWREAVGHSEEGVIEGLGRL